MLQNNGMSATFDFGMAQLEELVALLQASDAGMAAGGTLSMVAVKGQPEGHYQLLSQHRVVGWAVRDPPKNEFAFYDVTRRKVLIKLVGRQDDAVALLSPIASPILSPRAVSVDLDEEEDDEEGDGDSVGSYKSSAVDGSRGLGGACQRAREAQCAHVN